MIAAFLTLLAVVNSPNSTVSYGCNGVQAAFVVNFAYPAETNGQPDLTVTSTTVGNVVTTLVYQTDYTLNVTSTQTTAMLTVTSPGTKCPSGNTLKILRNVPLTQPQTLSQQNQYFPSTVMQMVDRATMQIQQVSAGTGGVVTTLFDVPVSLGTANTQGVSTKSSRADHIHAGGVLLAPTGTQTIAGFGNVPALTLAGSGTGTGITATGGTTGAGLTGIGGATSGAGVTGTGTGATATGGSFTGGASAPGLITIAGGAATPVRGSLVLTPQVAPTTPTDGDTWVETTSNTFKARINGVTQTIFPQVGATLLNANNTWTGTNAHSNSVPNTAAITATGNGTGNGVTATGGATGNGGSFTGGATSGIGVTGTGTGGLQGGQFNGQGAGVGLTSTGGATAAGISANGGVQVANTGTSGRAGAILTGSVGGTGLNNAPSGGLGGGGLISVGGAGGSDTGAASVGGAGGVGGTFTGGAGGAGTTIGGAAPGLISTGGAGTGGDGVQGNGGSGGSGNAGGRFTAGPSGIGVIGSGGTGGAGGSFTGNGVGLGLSATGGASAPGAVLTAGGGATPTRGSLSLIPENAPTVPVDGDVWVELLSNQIKARLAGVTQIIYPQAGAAGAQLAAANMWTNTQSISPGGPNTQALILNGNGTAEVLKVNGVSTGSAPAISSVSSNTGSAILASNTSNGYAGYFSNTSVGSGVFVLVGSGSTGVGLQVQHQSTSGSADAASFTSAGGYPLRLSPGTIRGHLQLATMNADPTTPQTGDLWTQGAADAAVMKFRNNSETSTLLGTGTKSPAIQRARVAGCTTAAALNATCNTTITWPTAFADANYTVVCSGGDGGTGLPVLTFNSAKTAALLTVPTMTVNSGAAGFTNISCIAIHD